MSRVVVPVWRGAERSYCCEAMHDAHEYLWSENGQLRLQVHEFSGCDTCGGWNEPVGDPFAMCPWCGDRNPVVTSLTPSDSNQEVGE